MQNEVELPFDGEELDVYEEVLALIVKSQGALTNLRRTLFILPATGFLCAVFEDIIAEEEAAGTLESYKAAVRPGTSYDASYNLV